MYGSFEIYPFSNSFIDEFVCHELITFDTRKINLDNILKTIEVLLSGWKVVIDTFIGAIPTAWIKFEDYTNDVLFALNGLFNRVFSSDVNDYADYIIRMVNEVCINKLMLDFSKLERLDWNEINSENSFTHVLAIITKISERGKYITLHLVWVESLRILELI